MKAQELLEQFVQEARECLEQVGDALLQVERNPYDKELLNNLFRLVHTLKGNCGLFDFKPLELVVHAGEDLLDQVRSGNLAYSEAMSDELLQAMDFTAQMVQEIARTGAVRSDALAQATEIALQLRMYLAASETLSGTAPDSVHLAESEPVAAAPEWLAQIPAALLQAHPNAVAWRYVPEAGCFFKGEDPWLYACQSPQLLHVVVREAAPWTQDLAQWDCYTCNLEIIGLSGAAEDTLLEHYRYVPEQITVLPVLPWARQPLPAERLPAHMLDAAEAIAARTSDIVPPGLQQAAHVLWQDQYSVLAHHAVTPGSTRAVRGVLDAILCCLATPQALEARALLQALPAEVEAAQLLAWAQGHAVPAELIGTEAVDADTALLIAPGSTKGGGATPEETGGSKQLKVAQEKIDRLMDLIGEMVVAKNALPYLAQRAEAVFQQRELAREIKAQYSVINRIAEDMQHAIMQVRMLPVGAVFQRFARLVRDISKKLGKEVDLVIEGEDTEADKNVIEALADPLIHILRNSLDHGIELPAVRLAAGKPARGCVTVRARQESDRVIIEIVDDGAGIQAQRVREKAVERGLIPADKADLLSDAEAAQLVFLPGFSTAEKVSDLSGRGVGMDVVRAAVERINGQVELSSAAGQGTQIRLSLPLSMAITNVMVIEVGGRRFGMPMDVIVETVRVHIDDIHHFKHTQTTVLRGKIVPLQALHGLLALSSQPQLNLEQELAVLVVRLGAENVGLLVDQFHGATDIILKPLEGVLAGLPGFAGTALMGDGSVLMVLNPKELY